MHPKRYLEQQMCGAQPKGTELITCTQKFSILHQNREEHEKIRTKQIKTDVDMEEEREFQDFPGNG